MMQKARWYFVKVRVLPLLYSKDTEFNTVVQKAYDQGNTFSINTSAIPQGKLLQLTFS